MADRNFCNRCDAVVHYFQHHHSTAIAYTTMSSKPSKTYLEDFTSSLKQGKHDMVEWGKEIYFETKPSATSHDVVDKISNNYKYFIHIPYFPAFHAPGWLLRYIFGPYDYEYLESLLSDIGAGITVGLTLIPQV